MNFTQASYPVDRAIFDSLLKRRSITKTAITKALGYGASSIGMALSKERFSRRMAEGIFNLYGITPNDYAPKTPGVNAGPARKPKLAPTVGVMQFDAAGRELRQESRLDEALLPDGLYTLEFVDVRAGRRSGDQAEGYRFVTVAEGCGRRQPYYFSLYDKNPGGQTENAVGASWIRHLLRMALGVYYSDDARPGDIVGHKVNAYVMIYDKAGKRYNRTVWVEPVSLLPEPTPENDWHDVLNMDTDSRTLLDALEYIIGELRLRQ